MVKSRSLETKLPPTHDLRLLTRARVREASALLDAGEWSGAYYLVGYAVECGLKACISKSFKGYAFPDPAVAKGMFTHSFIELVRHANLEVQLRADMDSDRKFAVQWALAKDWKETSRYAMWRETDAREMYNAITMPRHGVLRWVKKQW